MNSAIGALVDETLAQLDEDKRQLQILEPGPEVVVGSSLWHECKAWRNLYFSARARLDGRPDGIFAPMAAVHLEMAANVLKRTPAPQPRRTARRTP